MKKVVSILTALLLTVSVLAGCGSNNSENTNNGNANAADNEETAVASVLKWNLGSDPKTLDPQLNSASDGGDILTNTFEGLMRDVNGEIVPGIAESYTVSDDQLVYTFTLRDAKWSDGEPVTAGDFEFGWKRGMDPATASEYAFIFEAAAIKGAAEFSAGEGSAEDVGVKALDDKTLEVTLAYPAEYFLGLTGFYTFMPAREDMVDVDGVWAKDPAKAISNGPFKLTEYKSGDKIVLSKNENYWNADSVKVDTIEASMIVEATTSLTAYQNGELDILDDVPSAEIARLQAEDPTFSVLPMVGTYYYTFNLENVEVLQDVNVRKALTYAIDRSAIVETVTKGGQIPATGFVPVGLLDADGNDFNETAGGYGVPTDDSMFDEAKQLLADAGYPNGEGFPELTLSYNTSEAHKAVAEAVQEMWKTNLGIDVKLTNSEWAVFQDSRQTGNFEIARGGWIGDYADPLTMLDLFLTDSSQNYGKWSSEAFDAAIAETRTTTGQDRSQKFYDAEEIMMAEMPMVPIYYYSDLVMVSEKVQGWMKTKMGQFYFGQVEIVE
ncbi:peptide ABC transporter substrate-binding protein [Clostridium sp. DL1XJH146]